MLCTSYFCCVNVCLIQFSKSGSNVFKKLYCGKMYCNFVNEGSSIVQRLPSPRPIWGISYSIWYISLGFNEVWPYASLNHNGICHIPHENASCTGPCNLSSFLTMLTPLLNNFTWKTEDTFTQPVNHYAMKTVCDLTSMARILERGITLTTHNWQKWKRVFLTCPCHKIIGTSHEAVGLKKC